MTNDNLRECLRCGKSISDGVHSCSSTEQYGESWKDGYKAALMHNKKGSK